MVDVKAAQEGCEDDGELSQPPAVATAPVPILAPPLLRPVWLLLLLLLLLLSLLLQLLQLYM
eukprot:COSAG01_NODE_6477_length_3644_cov_2.487165_3_plen_62_part_00